MLASPQQALGLCTMRISHVQMPEPCLAPTPSCFIYVHDVYIHVHVYLSCMHTCMGVQCACIVCVCVCVCCVCVCVLKVFITFVFSAEACVYVSTINGSAQNS